MFEVQRYSRLLYPGRVEDGPPYPPPGDFVTLSRRDTLTEAIESASRILTPWAGEGRMRKLDDYRIARIGARGRVLETFDTLGRQTGGFVKKQKPVARKRRKLVAA